MKPMLDRMVDRVVASLSGEARSFYDREFNFFNEVTDISGKLKPFIKKTKPEKKVRPLGIVAHPYRQGLAFSSLPLLHYPRLTRLV